MTLDDYLDAAMRRPWIYGGGIGGFRGHDCMLFAANWALAVTGQDPAADRRCSYDNEAGAQGVIAQAGGLRALMDAALTGAGWREAVALDAGHIGIVRVAMMGSRTADLPAVRLATGWIAAVAPGRTLLHARSAPCVAAWRPA